MELEMLERRIDIVKYLQGKRLKTSEIASYYDVVPRTICSDLESLRDGIDVLGTNITIRETDDGWYKHYESTIHPIVLAPNLSELLALLTLLDKKSREDFLLGGIYGDIFDSIYTQLTPYAKEKLGDKLQRSEDVEQPRPYSEGQRFSESISYKLMYWYKSGMSLPIEYKDDSGETIKIEARLIEAPKDRTLFIRTEDGEERTIDYEKDLIDWQEPEYR